MKDAARGVFQLTGPRDLSYLEIGRFIAAELGVARSLVNEGSTIEAGLPAGSGRMHTTLDSSRLRDRYGIAPPDVLAVVNSVIGAKQRKN
jgi:dTDP-4-dehydrorhamnose reductase